jgi:hypothetical protein
MIGAKDLSFFENNVDTDDWQTEADMVAKEAFLKQKAEEEKDKQGQKNNSGGGGKRGNDDIGISMKNLDFMN